MSYKYAPLTRMEVMRLRRNAKEVESITPSEMRIIYVGIGISVLLGLMTFAVSSGAAVTLMVLATVGFFGSLYLGLRGLDKRVESRVQERVAEAREELLLDSRA